ncbi:MAG: YicC family protein [Verrucomicrobiales bacterium]|nr:YicC family protein [Verrucomicrobiales bacterium]
MKSMTGYGRGEASQRGHKITAELSSVNRRQSEISVSLPRALESLESRVRDEINRRVARGRLNVRVSWHAGENDVAARARINAPLAKAYVKELSKLARELKVSDSITLDMLLRVPGVLEDDEDLADADEFWPTVERALMGALDALVKMREREGAHLAKDLRKRMAIMRQSVGRIGKAAPQMVERYREQLRERIKSARLETPPPDDERLMKEVVYFADRSDISEEITRLQSHFKQFDDLLKTSEPIGRTLDFLAQEMNREVNTLGAKANDSIISREVVVMKAELEKFREQVQNVE